MDAHLHEVAHAALALVFARLRREPAKLYLSDDVDWNYYLEVILPAVSDLSGCGQYAEDPVEVRSPASVDWDLIEHAERGDTWADVQRVRRVYNWESELLEEYPDFWESWSP